MSLQSWQRRFAAQLDAAETPADPGTQVYHHNVRAQFRKALAMSFPVVADLLGESLFNNLAERFRQRNPSRSGDLHPSGGTFPEFLAADAIVAAGEIRDSTREALAIDLPELARLEVFGHLFRHIDPGQFALARDVIPPAMEAPLQFHASGLRELDEALDLVAAELSRRDDGYHVGARLLTTALTPTLVSATLGASVLSVSLTTFAPAFLSAVEG